MPAEVDILLGTFDGADHIVEQLQSLKNQTITNWRLIVRDDGSQDGTPALVREWCQAQSVNYLILDDDQEKLGAMGNFSVLLGASDAPYFCFCDQDDVWLPEKIETLLDGVRREESQFGEDVPILAHSDLLVVDSELELVSPSYWQMLKAVPSQDKERHALMLRNYVTGCASLGNAALARASLPIPSHSPMHDWWMALVAAHTGRLVDIPTPTIKYRQHGKNALGAKDWSALALVQRIWVDPLGAVSRTRRARNQTIEQAKCFFERYGGSMAPGVAERFSDYGTLAGQGFVRRKTFPFRHNLDLPSRLHRAIHWIFL